jgi:CRISPR-associated endonuclease Cas2
MKTISTYYLLMYDITNDKTLQKVAKKLISYGFERINYSVWLGWVNPLNRGNLKIELQTLMRNENAKGSRLYIIPVKPSTLGKMRSITGHKPKQLDYWLGKTKNVFF